MNIIHLSSKKTFELTLPGKELICNTKKSVGTDFPSDSNNLTTQVALAENDICNPLLRFGRQIIFRWLTLK
jgi:hypothetical protein